jgi:hypothetical protein
MSARYWREASVVGRAAPPVGHDQRHRTTSQKQLETWACASSSTSGRTSRAVGMAASEVGMGM